MTSESFSSEAMFFETLQLSSWLQVKAKKISIYISQHPPKPKWIRKTCLKKKKNTWPFVFKKRAQGCRLDLGWGLTPNFLRRLIHEKSKSPQREEQHQPGNPQQGQAGVFFGLEVFGKQRNKPFKRGSPCYNEKIKNKTSASFFWRCWYGASCMFMLNLNHVFLQGSSSQIVLDDYQGL